MEKDEVHEVMDDFRKKHIGRGDVEKKEGGVFRITWDDAGIEKIITFNVYDEDEDVKVEAKARTDDFWDAEFISTFSGFSEASSEELQNSLHQAYGWTRNITMEDDMTYQF